MPLSSTQLDELAADMESMPGFPSSSLTRGRRASEDPALLIESVGPLTTKHITAYNEHVASGADVGSTQHTLKSIRQPHHRMAQLVASGVMKNNDVARLCSVDPSRLSWLCNHDPAFMELVAYYAAQVNAEFKDFAIAARELSDIAVAELRQRITEEPEKFSVNQVLEIATRFADRTGNGVTQKNVNVNINADLGSKLDAAKARLRNITPGAAQ